MTHCVDSIVGGNNRDIITYLTFALYWMLALPSIKHLNYNMCANFLMHFGLSDLLYCSVK